MNDKCPKCGSEPTKLRLAIGVDTFICGTQRQEDFIVTSSACKSMQIDKLISQRDDLRDALSGLYEICDRLFMEDEFPGEMSLAKKALEESK